MKMSSKNRALRIIGKTAAALTACGGAVCLFIKKKRHFAAFILAAVVIYGVMMGGMTAYAYSEPDDTSTETEYDYSTEPDEIIIGDEVEIDITDFVDTDKQPSQLTPPGNLTLVDDLSGIQTDDKQFITVITKSGNYFYIIIDRAGDKENVHFLNLVDEYDLLAILEEAKDPNAKPATTPATITPAPEQPTTPDPAPAETEPKNNNTAGLLIILLIIAVAGGGAFYWFKIRKPKQGGGKGAGTSELDEFDFDADEDDFISVDTNGGDYINGDNSDTDEDIPDFTATPVNEISLNMDESEDI